MHDMPVNPPGAPWGTPPMGAAPTGGPPPTPPSRRRLLKAAVGIGAAAGVAVGAGALANAATSSSDTSTSTSTSTSTTATDPGSSSTSAPSGSSSITTPPAAAPNAPFGPRGRMGHMGGGPFGGGIGGPVVHGEFTVNGPNGYETVTERTGTVSGVTDTAGSTWTLTVKSADGTSGTFTVDAGTSVNGGEMGIGSVKQGDTVRVEAIVSGSTSTAKQVVDETTLQANAGTWRPMGPRGAAGGPSSSTSAQAPPV